MDYAPLIERRRERLQELETLIADPELFSDGRRAGELMREHRRIQELLRDWDRLLETERQLEENRELASGEDPELAEMAQLELEGLEAALPELLEKIQYSLLPRDATEDRDAIVEIRAGTGGDEAALFAGDLLGMYQRYADSRGWKFELLDASPCDVGGFREVTARVSGEEVFRFLKYESGVHRVQRVPATETQGRIHTSTATVAVLPEAEEVDIEIRTEDLRIETCRAGRATCEPHGIRRADIPPAHGHHGALRKRTLTAQEQRNRHAHPARPPLRNEATRGTAELFRPAPRPHRLRRSRGKNPHLQFPAKPPDRPPHRLHRLQSGYRGNFRCAG